MRLGHERGNRPHLGPVDRVGLEGLHLLAKETPFACDVGGGHEGKADRSALGVARVLEGP